MNLGRDTLLGPACWVCGTRFKNSIPPGPANREDHHIWPRNAGGEEGPLVSLCDSDHATLHKVAKRLHSKAIFADLLAGVGELQGKKLLFLAHQVWKAESAVEGDPNKMLGNSIKLTQEETLMISRLQKMLGKTRQELLKIGLRLLYGRYFK